jgi:hypothetical protein
MIKSPAMLFAMLLVVTGFGQTVNVVRVIGSIPAPVRVPGPMPKFAFDTVLYRSVGSRGEALVSRTDRDGAARGDIALALPGVARIILNDAAVSPSGLVCMAATLVASDNRTTSEFAWADNTGRVQKLVETAPFAARSIAFADEGTLWAMGREYETDRKDKAEYAILRQYDVRGQLVQSVLPRSSFADKVAPHQVSTLVAGQGRVGLLTPSEWVELSSSTGQVLGRWRFRERPKEDLITGVAIGIWGSLG